MSHVITKLIAKKYFTLELLNARKQSFNLGETEVGNQSPIITESHLKNKHFKMSAREMFTFVHHFHLIIGDCVTQHDDEIWVFFLTFLKMIDIILLSSFNEESLHQLEILVKAHNEMYVKLFSDTLKPKHHFLTHYARIVKDQGKFYQPIVRSKYDNALFLSFPGPLKFLWTYRYESFHKDFKMYARVITSRKNISLTLGIKASLKFAYRIMSNEKISIPS